jgi:hypothetical protein
VQERSKEKEGNERGNFELKIKCDKVCFCYNLSSWRAFLFLLLLLVAISTSKRESRCEELLEFRAGRTFQ